MILLYHRCGWVSEPFANWDDVAKTIGFPLMCRKDGCHGGASYVAYDPNIEGEEDHAKRLAGVKP